MYTKMKEATNDAPIRRPLRTHVRAGDNPGMGPYAAETFTLTRYIFAEGRPVKV